MSWPPPPPPPSSSSGKRSYPPPPPPNNNNPIPPSSPPPSSSHFHTSNYARPPNTPYNNNNNKHYNNNFAPVVRQPTVPPPPPSFAPPPPPNNYAAPKSNYAPLNRYPPPPPPPPTATTTASNRYPPVPPVNQKQDDLPSPTNNNTYNNYPKKPTPKIESGQMPRPLSPDDETFSQPKILQWPSDVIPRTKILAERTMGTSILPLICQPMATNGSSTTYTNTTSLPSRCQTCGAHDNIYNYSVGSCCLCGDKRIMSSSTQQLFSSPTTLHTLSTTETITTTTFILGIVLDSTLPQHRIKQQNNNSNNDDEDDDDDDDDIWNVVQQFLQQQQQLSPDIQVSFLIFSSNRVYIPYCSKDGYWQTVIAAITKDDFVIPIPLSYTLLNNNNHVESLFTNILPLVLEEVIPSFQRIVDHTLYLKFLTEFSAECSSCHACLISPVAIYQQDKILWKSIASTAIQNNVTLHIHHIAFKYARACPSNLMELTQITNGTFTTTAKPSDVLPHLMYVHSHIQTYISMTFLLFICFYKS